MLELDYYFSAEAWAIFYTASSMNSSLITLRYCLRIIGENCQSKSLKSHDLQHYQPQYVQGSDLLYIRVHNGIFVHHWAGSFEFWTQSSERMMTRLVRCPDRTVCSFRTKHFNETFSVLVYRSTRFVAATDRQTDRHSSAPLSLNPPPPQVVNICAEATWESALSPR